MNTKTARGKVTSVLLKRKADSVVNSNLLSKLNRLQEDYWWISITYDKIIEHYQNEFIAVKDKQVVFRGNTIQALAAQILSSNNNMDDFAIEFIKKQPTCLLL
jgi:hypothetical protein